MLSKLPAWVWAGAFILAFAAGSMNAFTMEDILREPVSNQTGNSAASVLALAHGDFPASLRMAALVIAFFVGAAFSGFIIKDAHLKLGRRYGAALLVESLVILMARIIHFTDPFSCHLMLSLACGLQNAIATTYSGAVIRTTHLTGILTDLGVMLGEGLGGIPSPPKKVKLLATILVGYLSGVFAGALAFPAMQASVLIIPMTITGMLGAGYFWYRIVILKQGLGRDHRND